MQGAILVSNDDAVGKDSALVFTPAADAEKLRARLTGTSHLAVKILDGGLPAKSEPCEAYAPHGFYGIEDSAVAAIAMFIGRPVSGAPKVDPAILAPVNSGTPRNP